MDAGGGIRTPDTRIMILDVLSTIPRKYGLFEASEADLDTSLDTFVSGCANAPAVDGRWGE